MTLVFIFYHYWKKVLLIQRIKKLYNSLHLFWQLKVYFINHNMHKAVFISWACPHTVYESKPRFKHQFVHLYV